MLPNGINMFLPYIVGPHLSLTRLRQMGGKKTAHRTASDDANPHLFSALFAENGLGKAQTESLDWDLFSEQLPRSFLAR